MSAPGNPAMSHEAVGRRAAEYFQRKRFWNWSEADQSELDAWLAESPLHRVAYLRVEWSASRAERLATLRAPNPIPKQVPGDEKRRRDFLGRRYVLPLLAAASVALVATFGIPFAQHLMQPPDRTYSTDIGGHALIKFTDRTQIELDTDTTVRYRMTNQERTVWLEKGEAWFRVAHDASRPFNVIVGSHRVTDIGTEFLVRRGADRMEVTLLKGRAALSGEGAQIAMLKPGDDAVATRASISMARKTPQEIADELAWRRGMLVFRNTRLADAVQEFNRYNETKLVIADPSIANLKVTAEIENDNFEGFLQLAEDVLDLRIDRKGNDIVISRAQRGQPKRAVRTKRGG